MRGGPGQGAWQGGGRAASCLALAEGFETARAFTLIQGAPCWASLSARRLDQILLPQGLTSLILAVDNDADGDLGADRAALRYARPRLELGRPSRRARGSQYVWTYVVPRVFRSIKAH